MTQLKSLIHLRKAILLSLEIDSHGNEQTFRTIIVLTKHMRVFGKFFRRLQQLSAERFASLAMSTEVVMIYWSEIAESTNYPQRNIFGQFYYYYLTLLNFLQRFRSCIISCQIFGAGPGSS